ncbi:PHA/PHB synthase family protein [Pontivivens ytuae]|uniref:Polyhydroxyalkanoic acid synthase n=1 Tax=Pontivivens ytuae TaxID=2789856 RepID=A0A7S9QCC0_9RHOB|nr:alpha/beta fold hydrolase [Pontivivens ytuae]QPH52941.1 polyhydroxyalkanoic acid synthase [Pontivivens ytuae]
MKHSPLPRPEAQIDIDSVFHAGIGRLTGGLSPAALTSAGLDWWMHLAGSPRKQAELAQRAWSGAFEAWMTPLRCALDGGEGRLCKRAAADKRFRQEEWESYPFNLFSHWFLIQQDWWQAATSGIEGIEPAHARMVEFMARQTLDMMAPSNFIATNPTVLARIQEERGANLARGFQNWLEDLHQLLGTDTPEPSDYRVGENVAVTPGEVVFRNRLIELIRYRPTTKTVRPEPILVVPAWIMKYYILDLSPHNSLVRYLRDQGFEVYMISWKNPEKSDADLGFNDYYDLGLGAALDVIAPQQTDRVHAVGYCLGGTMLATGAAAMARDGDARLATLSMLAAQVDFTEAGELSLFISESQVTFLEDIMAMQGYLRADQMAGTFQMLRSNDLIWSRVIRHYLLGERTAMNDLMAWNADTTRMPARMHSEYLRQFFLENRLARGQFEVAGRAVALTDITAPIFCLATEKDHVSPWRSVYKIGLLTDTDVTFCLTAGGHNGGVLSEPGHPRRHHRIEDRAQRSDHVGPEEWLADTPRRDGSWWPAWIPWLEARSGSPVRPEAGGRGHALGPAPGSYVFA